MIEIALGLTNLLYTQFLPLNIRKCSQSLFKPVFNLFVGKRNIILFFIILGGASFSHRIFSQTTYAHWNQTELVLNNGIVKRTIHLPQGTNSVGTTEYKPLRRV
jgi:hypothetical protein